MGFNLNDYEPVEERLPKFWADHPRGRIVTELCPSPHGEWVVFAALYREDETAPYATGLAHEVTGDGNVNRTSALENCETSAIGRALANAGYATKKRPSREEMEKVQRGPQQRPQERNPAPTPKEGEAVRPSAGIEDAGTEDGNNGPASAACSLCGSTKAKLVEVRGAIRCQLAHECKKRQEASA